MEKLNRTLGLPALLVYGVGVIIGAGIYSIIGAAIGVAGKALWLSMLLAAVPAALASLCYAELATMLPRAGAAYVFVREALPKRRAVSFSTGSVVAVTGAATCATVALAFGGYARMFLGLPAWLFALLLLAACALFTIAGIRESTWATAVCTAIEVVGLLLIIFFGLRSDDMLEGVFEIALPGVLAGAGLSFFVFTGFEGLANLSEEVKEPGRNLPLGIIISLVVTTVLYLLVALSVVAFADPQALVASDSPLADAVRDSAPWAATALGWIALFSTANTALITIVVMSRQLYGIAGGEDMPEPLGRTLAKRRTPWVAMLVIAIASAALLPLGGVAIIGSLSSLATLIVFAAVSGALNILR